jgi:protein tyrosine/serine phosphatase
MINDTESFLRSSEVHHLFIQELAQGTFDEASDDHLRSSAVRQLIEDEILRMLQDKKTAMLERVVAQLSAAMCSDQKRAQTASEEN